MIRYHFSHEYKYIWYIVPKCGRTSLLKWLKRYNFIPIQQRKIVIFKRDTLPVNHTKYFTFAFCRNPYDRLVSAYFDKVKKQQLPFYSIWKDKTFEEFANDICDMPIRELDGHLVPQTFLIPKNLQFLGRFENLNQDIQTITNKLFNMQFDNTHYNRSKHKHYLDYYDSSLKQKVHQKYKKDFERFHYNFD